MADYGLQIFDERGNITYDSNANKLMFLHPQIYEINSRDPHTPPDRYAGTNASLYEKTFNLPVVLHHKPLFLVSAIGSNISFLELFETEQLYSINSNEYFPYCMRQNGTSLHIKLLYYGEFIWRFRIGGFI